MAQNIKVKKKKISTIDEIGWQVVPNNNIKKLKKLRSNVYEIIKDVFELKEKNINKGLNLFHNYTKNINDTDLNSKKIEVIKKISHDHKLVDLIFESFSKHILYLLGRDLLVQKTINVVIQRPGDKNPTIPHRDAPPNSFFELVLWIPLVDCEKSKSMYTIDIKTTSNSLNKLSKNPKNWMKFLNGFKNKKKYPKVKFGKALFFLPYIYHGSDINKTNETRFSLNIRFKNLFSPSGRKFPLHFFRLYKLSKFTSSALKNAKEEMKK